MEQRSRWQLCATLPLRERSSCERGRAARVRLCFDLRAASQRASAVVVHASVNSQPALGCLRHQPLPAGPLHLSAAMSRRQADSYTASLRAHCTLLSVVAAANVERH